MRRILMTRKESWWVGELELHHRKAEKVRQSMRSGKETFEQDQTYEAFTFDLEKTPRTP